VGEGLSREFVVDSVKSLVGDGGLAAPAGRGRASARAPAPCAGMQHSSVPTWRRLRQLRLSRRTSFMSWATRHHRLRPVRSSYQGHWARLVEAHRACRGRCPTCPRNRFAGEFVDARSDLYSLVVSLPNSLRRGHLFVGPPRSIINQHLSECAVRPSEFVAGVTACARTCDSQAARKSLTDRLWLRRRSRGGPRTAE